MRAVAATSAGFSAMAAGSEGGVAGGGAASFAADEAEADDDAGAGAPGGIEGEATEDADSAVVVGVGDEASASLPDTGGRDDDDACVASVAFEAATGAAGRLNHQRATTRAERSVATRSQREDFFGLGMTGEGTKKG